MLNFFAQLHDKNRNIFYRRPLIRNYKERVVFEGREKGKEVRANLQFRSRGSLLCKWIMVLQRLAGLLGRLVCTLLLPKGSSLTARRRVRWESYGSGEIEANWRAQHGFEVAGASRASNAEQWELSSISLWFDSPFLALPPSPLPAPSFMPIRPSTRAHPYKDTWRSVDWDASGEAIIVPVTRPYESCLNESTRARSVDTRAFVLILYCPAVQRYSRDRWAIVGSY